MEFKVGDRVNWEDFHQFGTGTVVEPAYLENGRVAVRFDGFSGYKDRAGELPDHHTPYAEDLTLVDGGWTPEEIRKAAFKNTKDSFALSKDWDEQQPNVPYYRFPGGIEVRQISAHLMSFPSQIMQYASRSGRVDGNCKSEDVADKIRDFEKIIDFAKWEIERLEEQK